MKIPTFKIFAFSVISAIGFFASSAKADVLQAVSVQFLGISGAYNDVFFGDYYGRNGDIEGHAAIKGNLDAQSYGFGSGEQNLHPGSQSPTLLVGGNAKVSGASVYDGDAYIAGTLTPQNGQNKWNMLGAEGTGPYNTVDPGYQGTPGTVYVGKTSDSQLDPAFQKNAAVDMNVLFDFALAENQLRSAAGTLWGLSDTVQGGMVDGKYTVDLTGQSGLQVVTIDASVFNALKSYENIYINAGADTTLIINVTDNYGLGSLSLRREFAINGIEDPFYGDFDGSNILINTNVSQVNVSYAAINASLLALDANVYVTHGNVDGQVFAASGYTEAGGEFHAYYTFDDRHLTGEDVTPEPATILMFGLALAACPAVRRLRKKRVL